MKREGIEGDLPLNHILKKTRGMSDKGSTEDVGQRRSGREKEEDEPFFLRARKAKREKKFYARLIRSREELRAKPREKSKSKISSLGERKGKQAFFHLIFICGEAQLKGKEGCSREHVKQTEKKKE